MCCVVVISWLAVAEWYPLVGPAAFNCLMWDGDWESLKFRKLCTWLYIAVIDSEFFIFLVIPVVLVYGNHLIL